MNKNDLHRWLRSYFTRRPGPSGAEQDEIDYNLLARYADGTASPDDCERVRTLSASNPLFAELVEEPGGHVNEPIRLIPVRRRWMPVMLRYAACLVAVFVGSVYLYTRLSDQVPPPKAFITAKAEQPEAATYAARISASDESAAAFSRVAEAKESLMAASITSPEESTRTPAAATSRERSVALGGAKMEESTAGGKSQIALDRYNEKDAAVLPAKKAVSIVQDEESLRLTGTQAKNEITLSATADKGMVESAAEPVLGASVALDQTVPVQSNLYALLVGIDTYNPKETGIFPLSDAVGTMEDAARRLQPLHFTSVVTLKNEEATREAINAAIMNLRRAAGPEGTVVIYLAGKGWRNPEAPDHEYFVPWDGSIATAKLAGKNIPLDTLTRYEEVLPVKSTCIILDCAFPPPVQAEVAMGAGGSMQPEARDKSVSRGAYSTKSSSDRSTAIAQDDLSANRYDDMTDGIVTDSRARRVVKEKSAIAQDSETETVTESMDLMPSNEFSYINQSPVSSPEHKASAVRMIRFGEDSPLLNSLRAVLLSNTVSAAESRNGE